MSYFNLCTKVLRNRLSKMNLINPSLFKIDFSVTSLCNSKCINCLLWQQPQKNDLNFNEISKLFSKLDINWLHLTGGEPFLRKDFSEIVLESQKIKNLIFVDTSTNGILSEKIVSDVKRILPKLKTNFEVGVSIDGTENIHNKLRGTACFKSSMKTFSELNTLSEENSLFGVHINHTLSPENISHFSEFIDFLEESNIPLHKVSFDVVRSSGFFNNSDKEYDSKIFIDTVENLIKQSKAKFDKRVILRRTYLKELKKFLEKNKILSCFAGFSSVYINSEGKVFPCTFVGSSLGDLRKSDYSLNKIFYSSDFVNWRNINKTCRKCLSGCEGITSIISSFPEVLLK